MLGKKQEQNQPKKIHITGKSKIDKKTFYTHFFNLLFLAAAGLTWKQLAFSGIVIATPSFPIYPFLPLCRFMESQKPNP